MLLPFCIPRMKECRGYSTPDVCPWCQTVAGLRKAVLNSLLPNLQAVLRNLYHNTSVQVSATVTQWHTSAMIAQIVCASTTSSLACLVSLFLMPCGLAGNTRCFRMLHSVFAFFLDWVVLALGSSCWAEVAEMTASLVLAVTMSWSRRELHHLVRYCLHPRAISAKASWLCLAKIKKI